jgi:hypothetical protein
LIHLRTANPALGQGQLVPLRTSNDAAAAYLRRDGNRVVMVVANLGTTALSGVRVASDSNALGQRFYEVTGLLGGPPAPLLRVRQNGQFNDYVPFRVLPPLTAHIVQLTSPSRGR